MMARSSSVMGSSSTGVARRLRGAGATRLVRCTGATLSARAGIARGPVAGTIGPPGEAPSSHRRGTQTTTPRDLRVVPIEQLALLLGVGLLSVGAMCVGLVAAWLAGRRSAGADLPGRGGSRFGMPGDGERMGGAGEALEGGSADADPTLSGDGALDAPRRWVRDRAVRIVALLFLVAVVVVVVALGDLWSDDQSVAMFALVAAGTLAVVFLGDLLPGRVPASIRGWLEAASAVGFLAVLVGLSGGLASPFVVGFFLLVGAAALSREGAAPVVLALVSAAAYGVVALLVNVGAGRRDSEVIALIAFQTLMLVLLAFLGMAAGREQRRARDAALRLARFDPLTGLYNRAHLFAALEREVRLSARAGRTFALLMIDLDGLKPVNDTFGHHYGDQLLRGVAEVIGHTLRTTDTAARYGGDEFVVLLPETDAAGAYVVAEKLRRDVAALAIRVSDRVARTSVSIGLVAYPEDGVTVEELMAAADAALYEGKRSGRDRIVGYTTRTERVATRMGSARGSGTVPGSGTAAGSGTTPGSGTTTGASSPSGPPSPSGRSPAARGTPRASVSIPVETRTVRGQAPWETTTSEAPVEPGRERASATREG